MTLPGAVLFPRAVLPLYIFEPRYRAMLADVLEDERCFALAQLDSALAQQDPGLHEPPHRVATVGFVHSCRQNEDGTSHLLLRGLYRVRVLGIFQEEPYRRIEVESLDDMGTEQEDELRLRRERLQGLVRSCAKLGEVEEGVLGELDRIDEPGPYVDLAAQLFCNEGREKQRLLETLHLPTRYDRLCEVLEREVQRLVVAKRLDETHRRQGEGFFGLN